MILFISISRLTI